MEQVHQLSSYATSYHLLLILKVKKKMLQKCKLLVWFLTGFVAMLAAGGER